MFFTHFFLNFRPILCKTNMLWPLSKALILRYFLFQKGQGAIRALLLRRKGEGERNIV